MEHDEAEELRRYEEERRAARLRRDRISWVVVGWVMAGALAVLAYDSATAALSARRDGESWAYPAALAVTCALALIALVARGVRRRRR
jgi:hypothetical protein